jgi:hypothetical protein
MSNIDWTCLSYDGTVGPSVQDEWRLDDYNEENNVNQQKEKDNLPTYNLEYDNEQGKYVVTSTINNEGPDIGNYVFYNPFMWGIKSDESPKINEKLKKLQDIEEME